MNLGYRASLIRATYEWIVQSELTPYLLINAESLGVEVPTEYVEEGKIILNAAPMAVRNFFMDAQAISFEASFSGQVYQIYVPMPSILGVYASENELGIYARDFGPGLIVSEGEEFEESSEIMPFESSATEAPLEVSEHEDVSPDRPASSHLKIVK